MGVGSKLIDNTDSGGNMCWTHCFAGEGQSLLLVENQHTSHTGKSEEEGGENDGNNGVGPGVIAVFNRDAASGKLTHSGVHVDVPQAVCVTAVRV